MGTILNRSADFNGKPVLEGVLEAIRIAMETTTLPS